MRKALKKRIRKEHTNLRFNILTILIYIIGIVLISKLFELQIVNGANYRNISNTRLSRESILEASRGEILDRSGNILATTTSSFNVELYKTKTDNSTLNKCILNLIGLFEQYNVAYPNNFPINNEVTEFTIKKSWENNSPVAGKNSPNPFSVRRPARDPSGTGPGRPAQNRIYPYTVRTGRNNCPVLDIGIQHLFCYSQMLVLLSGSDIDMRYGTDNPLRGSDIDLQALSDIFA